MINLFEVRLAIVGLGYVGLPLAVEFGKQRHVLGFDIKQSRVAELEQGTDRTLEVPDDELRSADIRYTTNPAELASANVFVVTTPTPIDKHNTPDLRPLLSATRTIGRHMPKGSVVIYESTVYPGATEEDCVPLLEEESGLSSNEDFFVGYSPERINPGDKVHRVHSIVKVTSGSTPEAAQFVDDLYRTIITAGTHLAPSIKVAEAAKVIENTQRDVNIALVNELAVLFSRLGIDTAEVLEAAGTKWNFLPFRPGLVGGHCIGVDPYYLTHKAQAVGYHPEIILAGRRLNDGMGSFVASQLVRAMIERDLPVKRSRILVMGLTFKEDTPDLRNSRVIDVIDELRQYGATVDVYDPVADCIEAEEEYGIELVPNPLANGYDAVVIAVAHAEFRELGATGIKGLKRTGSAVIYDLKHVLAPSEADLRL